MDGGRHEADDEVSLTDLLIVLGEEKKLVFGLPAIASILAVVVSLLLPIEFTASTTFLPPQQQQSTAAAALQQLGGLAGIAGGVVGLRRPEDLYVAVLKSDTLRNALVDRFDLMKRYKVKSRQHARDALAGNVDIRTDKTGLLTLQATDTDPEFAAQMANAHVEELRKLLGSLAVTEAQQRRAFFEQQLLNTKEGLVKAEVALKQTQERTGLIALDKQGDAIIRAVAELRAQIVSREVQLQAMRNFATPQNADVQRLTSEISGFKAQLAKLEGGQIRGQGDVIVPTGKVPEAGLEYIRALREVKYHEAIFELLARQFELAKADEAREGPIVQQVDVASPPEFRSKPKRRLIVLTVGMIAGLLAIVLALVRVSVRKAMADPGRLKQLDVLRMAWRIRSR